MASTSVMPPTGSRGRAVAVFVKILLWELLVAAILVPIYPALIASGLAALVAELGQPLWKAVPIPGFRQLKHYEGLRDLKLAHLLSLGVLIAVHYIWIVRLRLLFGKARVKAVPNQEAYRKFVGAISAVILIGDTALFYYSLVQQGVWGSSSIVSVPAALATAVYCAFLIFVSFVTVNLED